MTVAVEVAVSVGVLVTVAVGVMVGVLVALGVMELVAVDDAVGLKVEVGVLVLVGVGVLVGTACAAENDRKTTIPMAQAQKSNGKPWLKWNFCFNGSGVMISMEIPSNKKIGPSLNRFVMSLVEECRLYSKKNFPINEKAEPFPILLIQKKSETILG